MEIITKQAQVQVDLKKCEVCIAWGQVAYIKGDSTLVFCAHHARKYSMSLVLVGGYEEFKPNTLDGNYLPVVKLSHDTN